MSFKWSRSSLRRISTVNPVLQEWAHRLIKEMPLDITIPWMGGVRTRDEQRDLVNRGVSKTMNSKHLTGHALDVVPYRLGGPDYEYKEGFTAINQVGKRVWDEMRLEGLNDGYRLLNGFDLWGWDKPHWMIVK
jgi:peptidoglycan L-alanyl-D-glutamate endopeptidase CwlK